MPEKKQLRLWQTSVFRLSTRYTIGFCILTIIIVLLVYHHVLEGLNTQINTGLRAEVKSLTLAGERLGTDKLDDIIRARSTPANIVATNQGDSGPRLYLLVSADGKWLAGALPHWRYALKQQGNKKRTTLTLEVPDTLRHLVENRHTVKLRSVQHVLADGSRLLVAQSLNEQAELHQELWRLITFVILIMLGVGLLGGWWIGKTIVRSLANVALAAARIMEGDLSQRIPVTEHHNEFALLARRLNLMLERIDTLMTDLRDVTINVAHNMRTPITRLRGHVEMALEQPDNTVSRQALVTTIQQSEALMRMLDGIMTIARVDSDLPYNRQSIDLAMICRDAAELYKPVAEDKNLDFNTEIAAPPLRINGNAQLLAQAVGNLLDNAIKYTPAGGQVRFSLEVTSHHQIELIVSDTGPGIPRSLQQKAIQRFARLDNSRGQPGNGLGLPLVSAVVARHEGELQLGDTRPGNMSPGLTVTIKLASIQK